MVDVHAANINDVAQAVHSAIPYNVQVETIQAYIHLRVNSTNTLPQSPSFFPESELKKYG